MNTRAILILSVALTAAVSPAQHLRHGVAAAEVVVVARHIGVQPLGNEQFLHRFRPIETLKGTAPERFTIVEPKRVADTPKPRVGGDRLYCLRPVRNDALPERFAPYFRLTGYRGDNPVVEPEDAQIRFARIVIAAQAGQKPQDTADALARFALADHHSVRTEAVQLLRERPVVRDRLSQIQRSDLLLRAVGETDDVPHKIALASLCAECRMDGIVESLSISLDTVPDPRFARALGRIARHIHGEDAVAVLRPVILRARNSNRRAGLLLALGATETEGALQALLRMRKLGGPSGPVDAALRAHGSNRALEAIAKKEKKN